MPKQRVFLIEFNELSPVLLNDFMERGLIPNFRRFWEQSVVYTTDAGEEGGALQPWVQWPSVHASLSYQEHGVYLLGDGINIAQKEVAAVLSDAGYRVGVFGSMNTNYSRLSGYFLPDPWDRTGKASPDWLQPYYEITSEQVKESTQREPLTRKQAVALASFLIKHGVSSGTVRSVAGQLLGERFNGGVKWRRASLFDRLQYDVFRWLNRRFDVQFATFFSNSTAHYQHFYWRHMEPERFNVKPSAKDDPSLGSAILYGYQAMDSLIERFLTDYADATLIFATALSQEPYLGRTWRLYKPTSYDALLKAARVSANVAPKAVMAEQFHLECDDAATAQAVYERLLDLRLVGSETPLLQLTVNDSNVFGGCKHYGEESLIEQPVVRASDGMQFALRDLFYEVEGMRSGVHNPNGALWVRNGHHAVIERKVSILDIAPTILRLFDTPVPPHMRGNALPEVLEPSRPPLVEV